MKPSIYLVLIFLPLASILPQTNWHWQNPLPQGNNLFDVQFVNSTTAYAAGSASTIIKTTDAGLTWNVTEYAGASSKILQSLYFLDENNGWAGGYDGKLLHTTNAGVSWDSVTGHTIQIITGISFPNPLLGIIVSSYQYSTCCASIFRTTDGGVSWTGIPLPSDGEDNLKDAAFANDTLGIAVGLFGNILKTTDAGASWIKQNSGTTENLYAIDNVGGNIWMAAGNGRIILKSTDGGSSWTTVYQGITNYFEGIYMVDENTAYVCGYEGEIQKTTDGGSTWFVQQSSTTNHLFDISFSGPDTGIAVGYYGTIVRTTDGGISWQAVSEGTIQDLNSIDFPDNQTGYACGAGGILLKTTNLGNEWQMLINGFVQDLYGISFTDANTGTAVGDDGIVLRTTNGGQNWSLQPSGITSPGRLKSVSFVNNNIGFAAGYNSSSTAAIIKTTDGGNNWTSLSPGISDLLYSIYFYNESYGAAVGANGAMVITTDAGNSWTDRSLGSGYTFSSVQIVDDSFFVTAGYNYSVFPAIGIVFISTDGGANWANRSNGIVEPLNSVYFTNEYVGTAAASYGKIYKTTDGGMNWTVELSGTDNSLHAITSIDGNNIFTVGAGGTILKSGEVTPVEIFSFSGESNGNNAVLRWKTASETNNLGFEIQRSLISASNKHSVFEKIGFIQGNKTTTSLHNYSFTDENLSPGSYRYRLKQIDYEGTFCYSGEVCIKIISPSIYSLSQNYPNPFNPSTTIEYSIPREAKVNIKVFNILGEVVCNLVNEYKRAGNYKVNFSVYDGNASNLSSGIYFYRIQAGNFVQTKKMILLK